MYNRELPYLFIVVGSHFLIIVCAARMRVQPPIYGPGSLCRDGADTTRPQFHTEWLSIRMPVVTLTALCGVVCVLLRAAIYFDLNRRPYKSSNFFLCRFRHHSAIFDFSPSPTFPRLSISPSPSPIAAPYLLPQVGLQRLPSSNFFCFGRYVFI